MMDETILICAPVSLSLFLDDVRGTCADCRTPIVWRPHAPAEAIRVCEKCAAARLAGVEYDVTPETRLEAALYPRGTRHRDN